ncbi:toll/interleukin-1 receptor domain-containing protein [Actinophytocola oryzae]|uniref:toll/interleukin-1 receptor domain-containing protein n=1 Tax=Actinophytocola oryzae TaxID=502181 RepID=UPI001414FEC5|nr:toll/interleukin-1 receptor domain-containing protein [Actinophytocola oryzae]
MSGCLFVNYRGMDSHSYGALLYTDLIRRFGEDLVFFDAESISAGEDYVRELLTQVRSSRLVLAVIGPDWLTATDGEGRRAIDSPGDWIRRELAEAFAAGVRVIPVLVDDAILPTAEVLPRDIAELGRCQARHLRRREFVKDLERLAADLVAIDPELAGIEARRRPRSGASLIASTGSGTTIQAAGDIGGRTNVRCEKAAGPAPTMTASTGSGTTIQAGGDISGRIRLVTFLSIEMPRMVRNAIVTVLVVALLGGATAAVVTWVLPEFAPIYKTEFLVDLSAAGADPSEVEESVDSLRRAMGNSGDDDAVALRTFGGECGSDGNTTQLVGFGTGNRDEIGDAVTGARVTGAATLLRGVIEAAADFHEPFSQDAKQVNRIVVVTRNGIDACDDDADFVEREMRDRLAASGLTVEFRFVGYRLDDEHRSGLDRLAGSADAPPPVLAEDPEELRAALDWIANVEPVLRSASEVVDILNPVSEQVNDAAQAVVDGRLDVAERTLSAVEPVTADAEFDNLGSRAKTPETVEVHDRALALRDRQRNAVDAVSALLEVAREGRPFTAELAAFRREADLYNTEVDALNTLLARLRAAGPGGRR